MLSLLKRYRELIATALLLVVPFVAFITKGHTPRQPNWLDRAVVGLSTPIQSVLCWAIDGAGSTFRAYVWLKGVQQENLALRGENARLTGLVQSLSEARAENGRLRSLLHYVDGLDGQAVAARVVGVNPDPANVSVRINRGESDGVSRGMAVITPEGVVGQVQRSTAHDADVLLLSDSKSKVAVRIARTRSRALAAAGSDPHTLRLEYALRNEALEEGDQVITSGTDGVFPPGLVVGRLTRIFPKGEGPFQSADILPAVDAAKLEEVLVVSSTSHAPLEAAGAAPPGSSPGATR